MTHTHTHSQHFAAVRNPATPFNSRAVTVAVLVNRPVLKSAGGNVVLSVEPCPGSQDPDHSFVLLGYFLFPRGSTLQPQCSLDEHCPLLAV